MKKYLVLMVFLLLVGCNQITNFEECVAAGNPVMESYPRQCRAGDRFFVEELKEIPIEEVMALEEALDIASDSECTEKGDLMTDTTMYNENSKTWWIDLEMKEEFKKEGCMPACVIFDNGNVEINWRCTGALPP